MHISLAIATIGRTQELARLLESLCTQSYTNFSVLICDQNKPGFLDETLAPFAERLSLTTIHMSPRGVSAARNALFEHITGDIVTFPDDDCWYAPDTLEQVVAFFAQHENVGSFMGVWASNRESLVHDPQLPEKICTKRELFVRGETYVQFFRRSVIDTIGGFDESLGPGTGLPYGCGEDTDYILRAAELSSVWRVPSVLIFHPLPQVEKIQKAKLYAYAYGRMYLLRKHKFPLWFKWANVFYPFYKMFCEGPTHFNYRWNMFLGRFWGLLKRN